MRSNWATTVWAVLIVTGQGCVPVHGPAVQPTKVDPGAAIAVKVTVLPVANDAAHVGPQSIPAGLLVTVPAPVPVFWRVRTDRLIGGSNVAVTDRFASIVT